jgi:hypothetical protein
MFSMECHSGVLTFEKKRATSVFGQHVVRLASNPTTSLLQHSVPQQHCTCMEILLSLQHITMSNPQQGMPSAAAMQGQAASFTQEQMQQYQQLIAAQQQRQQQIAAAAAAAPAAPSAPQAPTSATPAAVASTQQQQPNPALQTLPIRAYLDQTVVPILLDGTLLKMNQSLFVLLVFLFCFSQQNNFTHPSLFFLL